jgi:hypothetical protein
MADSNNPFDHMRTHIYFFSFSNMTDSNDPFDHINCRTVLLKLTGIGNLARWVCTLVSISFSKFFFGLVFCVRWLIHVFGFGFFFFQIFYFLKNAQESFFFFLG